MAKYLVFTRKQLEDSLNAMGEGFDPTDSNLNLAVKIENSRSKQRTNIVMIREQYIAAQIDYALRSNEQEPTKKNWELYTLKSLQKLATELGFIPEEWLRSVVCDTYGILHPNSNWDELDAILKEWKSPSGKELLRQEIQNRLFIRIRQVQAIMKLAKEAQIQDPVVKPYNPNE